MAGQFAPGFMGDLGSLDSFVDIIDSSLNNNGSYYFIVSLGMICHT